MPRTKNLKNLQNLKKELQSKLTGFQKIAILGVGSELRGDDVVGLLTTQLLAKKTQDCPHVKTILGSTAPENFTGEIRQFAPSHLLVIDAANLQKDPGTVDFLPLEDVAGSASSTHALPLSFMLSYLQRTMDLAVILLGIQPLDTTVAAPLSPPLQKTARSLAKILVEIIQANALAKKS